MSLKTHSFIFLSRYHPHISYISSFSKALFNSIGGNHSHNCLHSSGNFNAELLHFCVPLCKAGGCWLKLCRGRHSQGPGAPIRDMWRISCINNAEITVGDNAQRTGGAQRKKVELKNNFSKRNSATQRSTVACYTGSHDWEGLEKFLYNEGAIRASIRQSC